MLDHWNKELKRQGSRSLRGNKGIREKIKEVANSEVEMVTSAKQSKITSPQRQEIAKSIDDLYDTFPIPMFSAFHEEYEKEVKKGIKSFIRSSKKK